MKRFGIYFVQLLLTSLVILVLLDLVYTYTYIHGTPRNKISHLLSRKNEKIDYIFLGSSRVDNNIDAELIKARTGATAINLGVQGGKIDDFYLMLQLLKKQNIESDAIFIQIDYIYNIKGNSEILQSSLMPFIHDEVISNFIKERNHQYFSLKYIPFYRYLKYDYKIGFREFMNTAIGKESWINLENGYFPLFGTSGKKLQATLPEKVHERNRKIEDINFFARKNGLKIIYFFAPYCSGTENLDFASQLGEKLPEFWNFSEVFLDEDNFFFDCGHLNNKGAKKFSEIFAKEINENDF